MKNFRILSKGSVKGGKVSYYLEPRPDNVVIVWDAEIKIKMGFFTKTYKKSGSEVVAHESVYASSYDELGEKVEVPDLFSLAVVNVHESLATLNLVSRKFDGDGTILADISQKYIEVKRFRVCGKAYGMSLTIEAVEA